MAAGRRGIHSFMRTHSSQSDLLGILSFGRSGYVSSLSPGFVDSEVRFPTVIRDSMHIFCTGGEVEGEGGAEDGCSS